MNRARGLHSQMQCHGFTRHGSCSTAFDSVHQQPRSSTLPCGLFFLTLHACNITGHANACKVRHLLASFNTSLSPTRVSVAGPSHGPTLTGSASEGSRNRKA